MGLRAKTVEAKEERRDVIVAAALDEFFDRGFSAARMDDIAERAGLSKGALYLYFKSKEDLFNAMIERIALPNVERMEAVMAQNTDIRAALSAMMTMVPTIIRSSRVPMIVKVLIAEAVAFPDLVARYREQVIERILGVLSDALARASKRGEIAIGDPALTARLIVAPFIFSAIWTVVFERKGNADLDIDALMQTHRTMLFKALGLEKKPI